MTQPHALITGASSGIGEAIARKLAAVGYNTTLVARREARLQALANALPGEPFIRPADLSDGSVVDTLIAEAEEALGPIEILVNNAGVQYVEPTVGVSRERIEMLFAVNTTTPLALQNAALVGMLERGTGTIVNIASLAAITPTPGMCHYNASKAALAAASESLRAEVYPKGVNVLTVYPGPVESDMEAAARQSFKGDMANNLPTGTPQELADVVWKAIQKRSARLVYPRVYGLTRYLRVTSEWVTRTFSPQLVDD